MDLSRPAALLSYFGTFALLVVLWLTYHRMMTGPYKPLRIDLFLSFGYLALVSLFPYAMYSMTRGRESAVTTRAAIAEYAILFALMMGFAAVVTLRNLRRGWWTLDAEDRALNWTRFVRMCVLCVMMGFAVAIDLTLGPTASAFVFLSIIVAIRIVRLRAKEPPSASALRIEALTRSS